MGNIAEQRSHLNLTSSAVVTVRFESLEYTASEADGSASVRVRKEGQSVNTISVQFTTLDGSAQCKYTMHACCCQFDDLGVVSLQPLVIMEQSREWKLALHQMSM